MGIIDAFQGAQMFSHRVQIDVEIGSIVIEIFLRDELLLELFAVQSARETQTHVSFRVRAVRVPVPRSAVLAHRSARSEPSMMIENIIAVDDI